MIKDKVITITGVSSAEDVASAIVRCVQNPEVEVFPNRASRLLVWANALAPSVVDKVVARSLRDRIQARTSTKT